VPYKKAPILEAVLEFRWSSVKSLEELGNALTLPVFRNFEEARPRRLMSATFDVENGGVSQDIRQVGFDLALKDGTERVFLEESKFVFIQSAPYDRWDYFCRRALELMEPTVLALGIEEFTRVGVRFVNRIDIPFSGVGNFNTDDYITIKFDGPRQDLGIIEEFQMRIVKPTQNEGISYALVVATSPPPLPDYAGIVLDIDVFSLKPVPASGPSLNTILATMRDEKNDIFERCLTELARDLFGGQIQ
jgi:uncharacterized protein (TIGR04255 family)